MESHETLDARIRALPDLPGVYIYRDTAGTIIYIGKAKRLKRRVASYFNKTQDSAKTRALVLQIATVDHIVTGSESEALLLEANMIKEHHPRYNIQLRDSKRYPWLCVSLGEDFPRMFKTRRNQDAASRCYGPYPNVAAIRNTIALLHRLFPFRYCRKKLDGGALVPPVCFYYHIKRCPGPCEGKISREEYRAGIDRALLFLEGRHEELAEGLRQRMREHARDLEFEQAARLRDQLAAVLAVGADQAVDRLVPDGGPADIDIAALAELSGMAAFAVLEVRAGKLVGQYLFTEREADGKPELFIQFLRARLAAAGQAPDLLVVPPGSLDAEDLVENRFENIAVLEATACDAGLKRLATQARANASLALEEEVSRRLYADGLADLKRILGLPAVPRTIEAFDIANTAGQANVAACVHFRDGKPDKKNYRKFAIRSVDGQDDFASIREAVGRRYQRLANEKKALPDLVLIDGGRGQLNAARQALAALGLESQPVASLAKQEELVFLPDRPEPLALDHHHFALRLLQAVRDEVHRYVNTFHEQRRDGALVRSALEDIPGIGPGTRRKLLVHFGSLEAVRAAGIDEIAAAIGSPARAKVLKAGLEQRIGDH